jgi:hypothetical protein
LPIRDEVFFSLQNKEKGESAKRIVPLCDKIFPLKSHESKQDNLQAAFLCKYLQSRARLSNTDRLFTVVFISVSFASCSPVRSSSHMLMMEKSAAR